jgi:beta-lactamase superfamily II metal-dependent hydrolase
MLLEIFDVEHGACALISTSNGKLIMIDCGHNSSTGWRPSTELVARKYGFLDKLIISNYDEDHVSAFEDLNRTVIIEKIVRNRAVSPADIRILKSDDGMGSGIAALVKSLEHQFIGPVSSVENEDLGDTHLKTFLNHPGAPPWGFDDENNLSLVTFVSCGGHRLIFPGDMEKAGWRALIRDPLFRQHLGGVTFFVASHHGRENGYLKEALDLCPNILAVIISDKKMGHQTQETVATYRSHARGFMLNGETRRVLTTRRDGYMNFFVNAEENMAYVKVAATAAA